MKGFRKLMEEVEASVPSYVKPADPKEAFKGNVAILKVPYKPLMEAAITLRRKGIAMDRAEAIEQAYDYLLRQATEGAWTRTGEVNVDRKAECARAFCRTSDNLALAKS